MKILVACEESQAVTIELRKLGHEAYSCDIEPCSGGHPEWHIFNNVLKIINGKRSDISGVSYPIFKTQDGMLHDTPIKWDMIVAFPPCTHLAVSGSRYFKQKQEDGRQQQGIDFFMVFANAKCEKIAIENPIGIMSSKWRKPDQIIQPYQFGHPESKKTCLWLKGLPKLQPTEILELPECGYWQNQTKGHQNKLLIDGVWIGFNDPRTAKMRSKTYSGIAKAMAEQWAGLAAD